MILQWTFPERLIATILTCKCLYQMAGSLLHKHHHLLNTYKVLNLDDWTKELDDPHPLQLVRFIIDEPTIAFYIRRLEYWPPIYFSNPGPSPFDDAKKLLKQFDEGKSGITRRQLLL